jgi:hypothetical protein
MIENGSLDLLGLKQVLIDGVFLRKTACRQLVSMPVE